MRASSKIVVTAGLGLLLVPLHACGAAPERRAEPAAAPAPVVAPDSFAPAPMAEPAPPASRPRAEAGRQPELSVEEQRLLYESMRWHVREGALDTAWELFARAEERLARHDGEAGAIHDDLILLSRYLDAMLHRSRNLAR